MTTLRPYVWIYDDTKMANSTTTLSKPNFETFTKDTFRNLLDDEDLSDITLACDDGQLVKAHKVVLVSTSSFFQTDPQPSTASQPPGPHPGSQGLPIEVAAGFYLFGQGLN